MQSFKREEQSIRRTCKRKTAYLRRAKGEVVVLNDDLGTIGPCSAME